MCLRRKRAMFLRGRFRSRFRRRSRRKIRRSAHVRRAVRAGERLVEDMIEFRRPGDGIGPDEIDPYLGTTFRRSLEAGEMLSAADLAGGR